MRVTRATAWAALGLLLLAGCAKSGGAANTASNAASAATGAPAAAAPASGPDTAIAAADLPHLKAGYWETSRSTNGGPAETEHFCSSGKPFAPPKAGRGCGSFSFKRTFLGAIVIDAACAEGPIASKLHMTVSGDFNASYTTDGQASISMQGKPASSFTTHSVTRYVGPCPAGAAPQGE